MGAKNYFLFFVLFPLSFCDTSAACEQAHADSDLSTLVSHKGDANELIPGKGPAAPAVPPSLTSPQVLV